MNMLDISVRNPVKVKSRETYTAYEISVQTTNIAFALPHSVTRRRFSEFIWLRKKLRDHHPQITPPRLPKKSFWGERFDPEFISIRMKQLEGFLLRCFEERLYFSDSSLHLFIQSSLSCVQIDSYLQGTLSQEQVHTARLKCQRGIKDSWHEKLVGLDVCDRLEPDKLSVPQAIPTAKLNAIQTVASSNDSVSDSLESDMYLSCAVGPGSIQ